MGVISYPNLDYPSLKMYS